MATDSAENVTTDEAADFTWRAHPARERPVATLVAALIIAAVGVGSALMGGAWWWGLVAATLLVLSLHRFFFPSTFTIAADGIEASFFFGSQRYQWKDIRRFYHDKHGAFLSTRSKPSWLDAYRGMHLLFGTAREEVLRRIRQRLEATGAAK